MLSLQTVRNFIVWLPTEYFLQTMSQWAVCTLTQQAKEKWRDSVKLLKQDLSTLNLILFFVYQLWLINECVHGENCTIF